MKFLIPTATAALALVSAPAFAQTAPATPAPAAQELKGPTAGATVYGPGDVEAGTIESISGNVAVLSTGKNKLSIPLDRFGKGVKGPTIALSREALDQAAEQAAAQTTAALQAKLVAGAQVRGSGGNVLGTVKESTAETVTLTTADGKNVSVPISAVGVSGDALVINMTAEQFAAAVASAGQ